MNDVPLKICNIYAPVDKTDRGALFDLIKPLTGSTALILLGDFNCILHAQDRQGTQTCYKVDVTSKKLSSLLADLNFKDAYRELHPRSSGFTWHSDKGTGLSRIDFIFLSKPLLTHSARILTAPFTDHSAVCIFININPHSGRRPGVWRLNTSLLT
ncbi:hypothetical protein NDU88_002612, partial [Pleurodeles waltl]